MTADTPGTMQTLADLAVSWGRVGLVGFGGGPAMIPLMRAECVDQRAWMTQEEFIEALALGYTLPGPIAAKMSVLVGLQVGGWVGAVIAFFAVMGPPAVAIVGLAGLFHRFRDQPAVSGAMSAVKPVVIGLLAWTVLTMAPGGIKDWRGALIAVAAVVALFLKVHPAIVLVAAMAGGAIFLR